MFVVVDWVKSSCVCLVLGLISAMLYQLSYLAGVL